MDSEHRHELEENELARWLAGKVESLKPQLPAITLGVVVLIAGIIGINGWKTSSAAAKADRWRDFAIAMEQGNPDLVDLKTAAENNPGTPVADWADVTWADGKLFQASQLYFRNRDNANQAAEEAVEVYKRLVSSSDRDVSERANFQLGRALELQGKLDEAAKQYARVTGAFAQVAKSRAEQLGTDAVKEAYGWITSTATASASSAIDTSGTVLGGLEPDDIPLPDMTSEEAESALDTMLQGVETETETETETEVEADESAEATTEAADEQAADEEPTEE